MDKLFVKLNFILKTSSKDEILKHIYMLSPKT